MTDITWIQTKVTGNGLERSYSALQNQVFKTAPEKRPIVSELVKCLLIDKSPFIAELINQRSEEIIPGLLKPFSDKKLIGRQAEKIAKDLKNHSQNNINIQEIWDSFCDLWNLGTLKEPRKEKLYSRRNWITILKKKLRRASYLYSSITAPTNSYVSDMYLQYSLTLKPQGKYKVNDSDLWTYAKSQYYKQYCRCSGYLVRSQGIGELATNRGLTPFAITITALPSYSIHSNSWSGFTADQTSKSFMKTFKIWTDSLRHANFDSEIIRVIEPQRSGTPHVHMLLFIEEANFNRALESLNTAFLVKGDFSGTCGIKWIRSYDWRGKLNYMLKTLWGKLKFEQKYEAEILAWSENGCHRRYGHVSTSQKYPSVALWDDARKGVASIGSRYTDRLREDFKSNALRINSINGRLNAAAKENNYAAFCRAFWDATANDEVIQRNQPEPVDEPLLEASSQLGVNNQGNYIYNAQKGYCIDKLAQNLAKVFFRLSGNKILINSS